MHIGIPRIERGGVRVAIDGAIRRLGSIGYTFDVQIGNGLCMRTLYLIISGGVSALWRSYAGYAPDALY